MASLSISKAWDESKAILAHDGRLIASVALALVALPTAITGLIDPKVDNETLLVHACESLASASIMASDLAGFIDGPQRSSLLGIAQVIMLGELAVNRVLDNLEPPA